MISISLIQSRLEVQAIDTDSIDITQISAFFSIINRFRPAITNAALGTHYSSDLPSIPRHVVAIISRHTGLTNHCVRTIWICLEDIALNYDYLAGTSTSAEDQALIPHAATQQLGTATRFCLITVPLYHRVHTEGVQVIASPHQTCISSTCTNYKQRLGGMKQFTGTLFSFDRGPVPINIMTMYCRCASQLRDVPPTLTFYIKRVIRHTGQTTMSPPQTNPTHAGFTMVVFLNTSKLPRAFTLSHL